MILLILSTLLYHVSSMSTRTQPPTTATVSQTSEPVPQKAITITLEDKMFTVDYDPSYTLLIKTMNLSEGNDGSRLTYLGSSADYIGEITWYSNKLPDNGIYSKFYTSQGKRKVIKVGDFGAYPSQLTFISSRKEMKIFYDNNDTPISVPFKGSWAKFSTTNRLQLEDMSGSLCFSKNTEWSCVEDITTQTTTPPTTQAYDGTDYSTAGTTKYPGGGDQTDSKMTEKPTTGGTANQSEASAEDVAHTSESTTEGEKVSSIVTQKTQTTESHKEKPTTEQAEDKITVPAENPTTETGQTDRTVEKSEGTEESTEEGHSKATEKQKSQPSNDSTTTPSKVSDTSDSTQESDNQSSDASQKTTEKQKSEGTQSTQQSTTDHSDTSEEQESTSEYTQESNNSDSGEDSQSHEPTQTEKTKATTEQQKSEATREHDKKSEITHESTEGSKNTKKKSEPTQQPDTQSSDSNQEPSAVSTVAHDYSRGAEREDPTDATKDSSEDSTDATTDSGKYTTDATADATIKSSKNPTDTTKDSSDATKDSSDDSSDATTDSTDSTDATKDSSADSTAATTDSTTEESQENSTTEGQETTPTKKTKQPSRTSKDTDSRTKEDSMTENEKGSPSKATTENVTTKQATSPPTDDEALTSTGFTAVQPDPSEVTGYNTEQPETSKETVYTTKKEGKESSVLGTESSDGPTRHTQYVSRASPTKQPTTEPISTEESGTKAKEEHVNFKCQTVDKSGNYQTYEIERNMVCDGVVQCSDASDEMNCPAVTSPRCRDTTGLFYNMTHFGICRNSFIPTIFSSSADIKDMQYKIVDLNKNANVAETKQNELEKSHAVIETRVYTNELKLVVISNEVEALKETVQKLKDKAIEQDELLSKLAEIVENMKIEMERLKSEKESEKESEKNGKNEGKEEKTEEEKEKKCKKGEVEFEKQCYVLVTKLSSYAVAESYCQDRNQRLATWSQDQEDVQRHLVETFGSKASKEIWIGYKYSRNTGKFIWSDNTKHDMRITRGNAVTACGALYRKIVAGFKCKNERMFICRYDL